MKRKLKIIARHKWVENCTITESYDTTDEEYRRFTATVDGWQGFKIYEGYVIRDFTKSIISRVKSIRQRIREGDDAVFHENTMLFSVR